MAIDGESPLILDEPNLMLAAARAGIGLAYLSEWNATVALAAGSLIRVLDEWTAPFPGLSLYYPGRQHVPAGLRALIGLIREKRADVQSALSVTLKASPRKRPYRLGMTETILYRLHSARPSASETVHKTSE
jgi:hypothetical protein